MNTQNATRLWIALYNKNGIFIFVTVLLSLTISLEPLQAVVSTTAVSGKEYSHFMDEDSTGAANFEQAIYWDGAGGALDTFDYTPGAPGPMRVPPITLENPETDALAFNNDFLFQNVRDNTSTLIFSTDADGAIYYESTAGAPGMWAAPPMINALAPPRDVDAIEVWGPNSTKGASGDDAFNYSLESRPPIGMGAVDPGFIPVWHVPGSSPGALGPSAFPLLFTSELAAAIFPLAPDGTTIDQLQNELDLDGMMLDIDVFEEGAAGGGSIRAGRINFTIDPIFDSAMLPVFDGGEIFTWDFAFPGPVAPASFLSHGGHTWDTMFSVMGTFGTATENVNGIEGIPEPTTGFLMFVGMMLLIRPLSGCSNRPKGSC